MVFVLKPVVALLTIASLLGAGIPVDLDSLGSAPLIVGRPTDAPLENGDVRIVARYTDEEHVPDASHFSGLLPRYRYHSVPAWILEGPQAAVERWIQSEPNLERVEYDRPLRFLMDTATFATNAVDVWGATWWPTPVARKSPSPLTVEGTVIDGRGVTVGVVDSGINALHPDLWYAPAYVPGMPWSPKVLECTNVAIVFEPDVGNPYCDESVGHGTHVAGIVAGTGWAVRNGLAPLQERSKPYVGAAPGASLVGAGLGAADQILLASVGLDWMYANAEEYGIRVVTNSWGDSPGCSAAMPSTTDIVVEITDALVKDKGMVVLFAASNYAGSTPTWTSTYARNPTPGVISVANYAETGDALNQQGNRNGKINAGSSDGCVASGGAGDYLWTWPDVAAPGTSIASTAAYTGVTIPATWDPGMYASASGTSMATPHVAGIVALMLQADPTLTPAEVERILIETSTTWPNDLVAARGRTGTGMWAADPSACYVTPQDAERAEAGDAGVNAKFPLFTTLAQRADADLYACRDFKRGAGLVDAYAAVQEALGDDDPQPTHIVTLASPANGSIVPAGDVAVTGTVQRPIPEQTGGGGNLFFVGDGSTTILTDADQATNFGLSSLGNGGAETTYVTALGNNAVPRNPFMPTFVGTERVHLSGDEVALHAWLLYTGAVNAVGNVCPLDAGLFDANGNSLLPAPARAFVSPQGSVQEVVFRFDPKAGTYDGLIAQVGASGADCGRFPQAWKWGTDSLNGRLELGSADWIGTEPVTDTEEIVTLLLDGVAVAALDVETREDGTDAFSTTIPASAGAHILAARWTEDGEDLANAVTGFIAESAREPDITITQPASDDETLRGATLVFGGGLATAAGTPWTADARIVDGEGAVVADWTRVAAPAPNMDGVWAFSWEPGDSPDAGLILEVRLSLDGAVEASASRPFNYDAPNEAPTAIIAAPTSAYRASDVPFDGSGSTDPDGVLAAYEWDFGDGTTATGASVSHRFGTLGLFTVTLTVTDAEGAESRARHTLDVDNAPPTASISGPAEARKNRDASFDGGASTDPDGSIRSYHWDFGDGEGGVGATTIHRFKREGTFVVTLTVVDNDWSAAATSHTVVVTK